MRRTLLLLTLSAWSATAMAQSPIPNYQGVLPSNPGNPAWEYGLGYLPYVRAIPFSIVDESAQGENLNWDFSDLDFNQDYHLYTNMVPDAETLANYPSCNFRTDITEDTPDETANTYAIYTDGAYSVLRADGETMSLDYTINTAFIGQFPMEYGYISSDAVAGNFYYSGEFGTFQGTFSGTVDSSFDAYGNLTTNLAESGLPDVSVNTPVNRLRVAQTVSLSVPFFPDAGTLNQVSYYYFSDTFNPDWPFLRSIQTHLTVPVLNIDETMQVYEKSSEMVLGTTELAARSFVLYPNPATDRVAAEGEMEIRSMEIFSLDGRSLRKASGKTVDVSGLSGGVYLAAIELASGKTIRKFVKK